ncbi:hypothetical protein OZN62_02540 [Aurantiacibacter sp. MUD11]|uniref:hypothetical protein n=1 Tax=Aurantiacibacter sp. MUD11 TaxID=3003265 RepID=UPI0022AB4024|nr:hypothetical protein [Aurantiacibacter sp. MUD11]WAT18478.1 hypothetical protein OZN62_02540 [Aurantiacibacter sp. MUD11]
MRTFIAIGTALALAACNGTAEDAETTEVAAETGDTMLEGDAPGFEAVAPGTYQVTRSGGEVDYIEIHPGMTFSRVDAEGNATGGVIFMKGGKTCFLVEGDEDEACFEDGPTQPDGSMETTSEAGDVSTVVPVEGSLEDHVGDT